MRNARQERLDSLDGLRGIAAVIVMLYHLSLVARPFIDTGRTGDAWWWLTQTPLKALTAGTEAVLVFFVLSGVVVTLPALRTGFSWLGYYGGRLLRIYLPVWGSIALAAALMVVVPRHLEAVTPDSWLARASARTLDLGQLLREASLWPSTYDVNNVLWSLRWEIIFSVLLPAFVAVGLLARRQWFLAVVLSVSAMIAGRILHIDALVYLPVFLLGVLMAVRMPDLRRWAAQRTPRFWAIATGISLFLLIGSWLLRPVEQAITADVLWALAGLGAAGLIVVALGSPAVSRVLSSRVPRWLGRISFALYLVQAPVIATLAFGLGDERWPVVVALGIPVCLLVAWGFYWLVEKPSHRLARWVSRVSIRPSGYSTGEARRVSSRAR